MIHVCFCLHDKTERYSKFVGTAMISIFDNISKPLPSITVHILHDNTLTSENRQKFSYLAGRYGQLVKFYDVETLCADKLSEMKSLLPKIANAVFNPEIFYKFLIAQVIPDEVKKVIYLDSSTIVNLDISELWRVELGDKILGVVPALAIGSDIHIQDKIVADGFVKAEDYFNSGVMLMNLGLLRGEEMKISNGMKFVNEHSYLSFLDQAVLNYCFSLQTVKLSERFNQFVRWARRNEEPLARKIYHFTGDTLQMNISDPFNRLWLEYFQRTNWFDTEVLGRLYESFRQSYGQLNLKMKNTMVKLSKILAGKKRVFFTLPRNVKAIKQIFSIRDDEKIIAGDDKEAVQKLIYAMKLSQGDEIFFILVPKFPYNVLNEAGFIFGRDFVNGMEFLPEENEPIINSSPFLKSM